MLRSFANTITNTKRKRQRPNDAFGYLTLAQVDAAKAQLNILSRVEQSRRRMAF